MSQSRTRSELLQLPEGVAPEGIEPLCRCHKAVKDGDFFNADKRKLYCRCVSIAQWTFESPVRHDVFEALVRRCTEGTDIRCFAWGETDREIPYWVKPTECKSTVFHILFGSLTEETAERIEPKAYFHGKRGSRAEIPPLVPDQTWTEVLSCLHPIRMEQLEEKLGVKYWLKLKCFGSQIMNDDDVLDDQYPFWWRFRM